MRTIILAAAIRLKDLPAPVSDWLVEIGLSSTYDPAVWVWLILERDDYAEISQVHTIVQDAIMAIVAARSNGYVRFRTASEMAEPT